MDEEEILRKLPEQLQITREVLGTAYKQMKGVLSFYSSISHPMHEHESYDE